MPWYQQWLWLHSAQLIASYSPPQTASELCWMESAVHSMLSERHWTADGGARSIADAVLQHSGEKEAKLQQHLQQILR